VSYALEFYSLSWDALKAALTEPDPKLIRTITEQKWTRLLEDTDIGQHPHHTLLGVLPERLRHDAGPWDHVDGLFQRALAEIGRAIAHPPAPGQEPPDVSDDAALVLAAFVRQLGQRVGAIGHDGSVAHDRDLPLRFRAMFLDGVVGSCFGDHQLGEKLAARPLFGLYHLDFLSWGGLSSAELREIVPRYALTEAEKEEDEWDEVADYADTWLQSLVAALRAAQACGTDLVTLYLSVPKPVVSLLDGLGDQALSDFFED
jgi:hypothetical protein